MELPNTKDLAKLVKFLRKEGISELKSGDFAISLSAAALFPTKPTKETQSENIPVEGAPWLNDEDAAIDWSSGGLDRSGAQ